MTRIMGNLDEGGVIFWRLGKESVVTIELTARDGKTELTLKHEGLPSEALAEDHRGGWTGFLDSLVERLR